MGNIHQTLRRIPECLLGRDEEGEEQVEVAAVETIALSKDNIGEAMSCSLPGDLMLDILSRLPVKSLMRFRCVSKSWKLLVISPTFIESHYARSRTEFSLLIQTSSSFYLCSRDKMNSNSIVLDNQLCLPFSPPYEKDRMFVAGSSNGLVCIECSSINHKQPPILWNPATREYKLLPPPTPLPSYLPGPEGKIFSHFTYIPSINSYKLVTVVYDGYRTFCIDILTITMNNSNQNNKACWRRRIIQPGFPVRYLWPGKHAMANESFNWLGTMNNQAGGIIVSFNFNSKYFYYLTLPHGSYNFLAKKHAATGDSQLAMFEYSHNYVVMGEYFRIWRFKLDHHSRDKQGYGNWVEQIRIKIPSSVNNIEEKPPQVLGLWSRFIRLLSTAPRIRDPYGLWLNGDREEVIFWDFMCRVILYESRNQSFYKLPSFSKNNIPELGNWIYSMVSHVDNSLFLLS